MFFELPAQILFRFQHSSLPTLCCISSWSLLFCRSFSSLALRSCCNALLSLVLTPSSTFASSAIPSDSTWTSVSFFYFPCNFWPKCFSILSRTIPTHPHYGKSLPFLLEVSDCSICPANLPSILVEPLLSDFSFDLREPRMVM